MVRDRSINDVIIWVMRTTVRLDPEVAAAAEKLRQDHNIGLGEAVNQLAKAGIAQQPKSVHFQQRTAKIGFRIDVTNIADTLELLDQYDSEQEK